MISGIGIDIVEIGKMKDLVTRYPAKLNSIFTPEEVSFCRGNGYRRFSAIFAAKEATLKSLSSGWEKGGDLLDIKITPLKNKQFRAAVSRRVGEKARKLAVKELKGSFSYSGEIAIAQVIALK